MHYSYSSPVFDKGAGPVLRVDRLNRWNSLHSTSNVDLGTHGKNVTFPTIHFWSNDHFVETKFQIIPASVNKSGMKTTFTTSIQVFDLGPHLVAGFLVEPESFQLKPQHMFLSSG